MTRKWHAALVLTAAAAVSGCSSTKDLASLLPGQPPNNGQEQVVVRSSDASKALKPELAAAEAKHAAKPGDPTSSLAYARSLKAAGKSAEAQTVLEKSLAAHPTNRDLQSALGFMELDLGNPKKAEHLLSKATAGHQADWRVLSGLGVASSTLGRQADAQKHLKLALKASPNNPAILNNLAISYLLDRKPAQAEAVLKQASASGTVTAEITENLALAKALKAQLGEAGGEKGASIDTLSTN
jgi:Flp pilus assembly protein TadD